MKKSSENTGDLISRHELAELIGTYTRQIDAAIAKLGIKTYKTRNRVMIAREDAPKVQAAFVKREYVTLRTSRRGRLAQGGE